MMKYFIIVPRGFPELDQKIKNVLRGHKTHLIITTITTFI